MSTKLFELATRRAFRFPSNRGELTTEQLWDLPLQSKSGFDLDTVAKAVNADLKAATEESFVPTVANPQQEELVQKLEVVKHIINVKIEERDAAKVKAQKAETRNRLLAVLADKQDAQLRERSIDELKAELAALD